MLRDGCTIGCLIFVIIFAGCANPPAPAPVADTREADIQSVRDVESAWLKDLTAKDAEKFFSYYADDASGLFPGPPILEGKQAIKASLAPVIADPNYSFTMQSLRTEASKGGDMAYSQGTYVQTMTDAKTGKPKTVKGKFVFIYRKQADGSWKAIVDAAVRDTEM
jgi:uncharacterized protein (TIGR02246 family)